MSSDATVCPRRDVVCRATSAAQATSTKRRRVEQLAATLLGGVSHELRTPLTTILGFARLVQARGLDEFAAEDLEYVFDRIAASADHLRGIVQDFTDVNSLNSDGIQPHLAPADLANIVRDLSQAHQVDTHKIVLELEPAGVRLDRALIRRAIGHLVNNAVKHTPAGTTVHITTGCQATHAVLVVEDDGPGIEPGLYDTIFDAFSQGQPSAVAASPGTGIGLALARRAVEVHGGDIAVASSPAGGARFSVQLPRHIHP